MKNKNKLQILIKSLMICKAFYIFQNNKNKCFKNSLNYKVQSYNLNNN